MIPERAFMDALQHLETHYSEREEALTRRLQRLTEQLETGLLQVRDLRLTVQHCTRQVADLAAQVARLQRALTPP
jgi:polyhydroxyalkanoate synthesis regulator phasin